MDERRRDVPRTGTWCCGAGPCWQSGLLRALPGPVVEDPVVEVDERRFAAECGRRRGWRVGDGVEASGSVWGQRASEGERGRAGSEGLEGGDAGLHVAHRRRRAVCQC